MQHRKQMQEEPQSNNQQEVSLKTNNQEEKQPEEVQKTLKSSSTNDDSPPEDSTEDSKATEKKEALKEEDLPNILGQISRLMVEQTKAIQALEQKAPPSADSIIAETLFLEENDVKLVISIEAYTGKKERIAIRSENVLPDILAQHSLQDAPKTFEHTLFTTCVTPMYRKFMAYITSLVENKTPVTTSTFANDNTQSSLSLSSPKQNSESSGPVGLPGMDVGD
jgi:hypothetical protein